MLRNILVCVDGSPHADRALEQALDLALAQRSRLTILTSVPRPPYWACSPATMPGIESLAADLARDAELAMRRAVDRVPAEVPVTTILSPRPIREALMRELERGDHDLVVMGSRGRGALGASLLGSVSHFALHHCQVPVLIVHAVADRAPDRPPAPAAPPAAAPPAHSPRPPDVHRVLTARPR